jgi:hypothetical protein
MTTFQESSAPAALSPRMKRLKRAAAAARTDADAVLTSAIHTLPAAAGVVPGLLGRAGAVGLRVLKRHPVSAMLIVGVLVGTVAYHRSNAKRGLR